MQKGQAQVLILAGIVILIAVAGGIFLLGRATAPQSTPTADETSNWKTYTLRNLAFKVPNDWWGRKIPEQGCIFGVLFNKS